MSLTISKKLDVTPGPIPLHIHLNQYDSDFSIVLSIKCALDCVLDIPSTATAKVRGTKADGNGYSKDATLDATAKTVTIAGDAQLTAAAGSNKYEIVIINSGKELSTANFVVDVEPAALSDKTVVSESAIDEVKKALDGAAQAVTYSFAADKVTASDGTEQEVTVTKVNGHTVEADVPANAKFTDTVPHINITDVYPDDTNAVSGGAVYRFIINGGGGHDANSIKRTDMDSALSAMGISTPIDYSNAKMLMANAGQFYEDDQNCVNVLAMAEIISALCQQIDSISAKQDALTGVRRDEK